MHLHIYHQSWVLLPVWLPSKPFKIRHQSFKRSQDIGKRKSKLLLGHHKASRECMVHIIFISYPSWAQLVGLIMQRKKRSGARSTNTSALVRQQSKGLHSEADSTQKTNITGNIWIDAAQAALQRKRQIRHHRKHLNQCSTGGTSKENDDKQYHRKHPNRCSTVGTTKKNNDIGGTQEKSQSTH